MSYWWPVQVRVTRPSDPGNSSPDLQLKVAWVVLWSTRKERSDSMRTVSGVQPRGMSCRRNPR